MSEYLPRAKGLKRNSQELRKGATKQERRLWYEYLKTHSVQFHRQKVIGRYIVDFYCHRAKLAVELDGSQHYEPESMNKDSERTAYLDTLGIRVLRFPNSDVDRDFEGVCARIDMELNERLNS